MESSRRHPRNSLEHKQKRLAQWRAQRARIHPNPYLGTHPDLFGDVTQQYPRRQGPVHTTVQALHAPLPITPAGRVAAAQRKRRQRTYGQEPRELPAGETPVFVPIGDLSPEQIRALKRAQFSDEEWAELDEDDAAHILDHDDESQARVDALAQVFIDRYAWEAEGSNRDFSDYEDSIESYLRDDADHLYRRISRSVYDELRGYAFELGLLEEDVDRAIGAWLADTNHLTIESSDTPGGGRGSHTLYSEEISGNVYVEKSDWEDELAACTFDEVERAVKKMDDETHGVVDLTADRLIEKTGRPHASFEWTFDTGLYMVATFDEGDLEEQVREALDESAGDLPDEHDLPGAPPPEERVVYRWPDGFYVQNLLPSELAAEGKAMGMCVGRPDMGYGRAVRAGEIMILSLRRPSGKPLFTIEAALAEKDQPPISTGPFAGAPPITSIEQVKGKANRKPGFDLGRASEAYPIKRDEVQRIYEFIEGEGGLSQLGSKEAVDDIEDTKPAAAQVNRLFREGDPWAIGLLTSLGIEHVRDPERPPVFRSSGPHENPSDACGLHGSQCTGFCRPYRRR